MFSFLLLENVENKFFKKRERERDKFEIYKLTNYECFEWEKKFIVTCKVDDWMQWQKMVGRSQS